MNASAHLIVHLDEPFDGPMNMAIDQAIAQTVARHGQPCLRLYAWKVPTLSLGYFQSANDRHALGDAAGTLPCVRRGTGGGAIVHDLELTYSWTVPASRVQRGANQHVYRMVHDVIISVIQNTLGVRLQRFKESGTRLAAKPEAYLCFERRSDEDLVCDGYKVGGSAQRRVGDALLQHGSVLLQTSRLTPSLPGIFTLAGVSASVTQIAEQFIKEMELATGLAMDDGNSTLDRSNIRKPSTGITNDSTARPWDALHQRAEIWSHDRFACDDWTFRR